jgi:hypothetical protein
MKNAQAVKRCLALLVFVAAIVAGCANSQPSGAPATPAPAATPAAQSGATPGATPSPPSGPLFAGTHYPSQGHTHLVPNEPDDFVYNSDPPTSGPHRELFTDVFISTKPLPAYIQTHLLEHGNILLQYNCNCKDVAASLEQIAMQYDKQFVPAAQQQPTATDVQNAEDQGRAVIVAPYPRMKSRVAVTAWTHLGTLSKVDMQKINSFISVHLGNPSE